ncbi:hypothetical protein [Terrabacter sp. NPDC080008]|uniref:hypothetical protein n=1 Tax=Terrabacter sp. NPDC080008 TaxID=3155176 RepID=UPI003450D85E
MQRGRRAHLPEDATPYASSYVDVGARVAWLLRISRLLSPHPGTSSLADFARRLAALGLRADPARISQWETAATAPSAEVLTAYEVALGLAPGQLLAVCEGLGHSVLSSHRQWVTPGTPAGGGQRRLDEAYERIVDGEGSGGDWLGFSGLLTAPQPALVPGRIVQDLTNRLVDEMTRSVGIAYVTRFESLCRMAAAPTTAASVVRGVTAFVRADGAQSILDAMTVYGEIPHAQVVASLVRTASADGSRLRLGAVHALLNMVLLGTLPEPTVPMVETLAVRLLDPRGDVPGQHLGRLLAERLREDSRRRVGRRSGVPVGTPAAPSRRGLGLPPAMGIYVQAAERASGVVADPMLARLLHELLAGDFVERQHQAALMLLASPYRQVLADTALLVAADTDRESAAEAVHMLTYLASAEHVPALRRLLLTVEVPLRGGVLRALAHADDGALHGIRPLPAAGEDGENAVGEGAVGEGAPDSVPRASTLPVLADLTAAGIDDAAVLYAAGMTGHAGLRDLLESPLESNDRRLAARWWRDHGPAVRS